MAFNLKTGHLDTYYGRIYPMTVNSSIYSAERHLSLVEIGAQNGIAERDKIIYAATIFSGSPAIWWFLIVKENHVLVSRSDNFVFWNIICTL